MIISVNWLKKFTDIDVSVEELAHLIGSRLVEIEDIIDLGKKYDGVVIAKIIKCVPLEGSDHLNVTKIDDGGVVENIERDENGLVQVVCGAPNVRSGLTVAWLPPGTTVPETYGKEPFVLGARELRGVMSNGMLASSKELDLWEDHTGILELDHERKAGERFAEAYELNDYLLDIENKSLTHRPDTFGIIGFAREVAGIQGKQFITPERLRLDAIKWTEKKGDMPTPRVTIDSPELASRYQAVVLTNVDSKAWISPLEIPMYLARVGIRPHSAVVDVTNYMMMLTGQPLHAFDYDKLKSVNSGEIDIHVRAGRAGETLVLLDGREIELTVNDIVIANGETAVALAGAMGGRDTEIDDTTTTVLLESASFNLYNLRNTQMRHGIFSEAITRFTKGQPAELTAPVLAGAIDLLSLAAGADRASDVADAYPGKASIQQVKVKLAEMNRVLGASYDYDDISSTLRNVEFDISTDDDGIMTMTVPYWRQDIHIAEDVYEEVGRLKGFDAITPTLPQRSFTAVSPSGFDRFRQGVRRILVRAGANEVLTYSFVHGNLIEKAGQDVSNAYKIINSISPDLQYYRLALTPSLLSLVYPNMKAGYDEFALFELNKTHSKVFGLDGEVPKEVDSMAMTILSKTTGASYYQAKRMLEYLGDSLGVTLEYRTIDENTNSDEAAPYDARRSAVIYDTASGKRIGIIGEYKAAVKKAFKLPDATAGFELDPQVLYEVSNTGLYRYVAPSKYPSTTRDICFKVPAVVAYKAVVSAASEVQKSDIKISITPVDIYQSDSVADKQITLRFVFTPLHKTMTSDEANTLADEIIRSVVSNDKTGDAQVI